ncbi:MAG: hypothetical protein H7Y18_09690 [Clostridiaceae bacterium]|nr:hypothetical protein [Clostridiaceae bacterium]
MNKNNKKVNFSDYGLYGILSLGIFIVGLILLVMSLNSSGMVLILLLGSSSYLILMSFVFFLRLKKQIKRLRYLEKNNQETS